MHAFSKRPSDLFVPSACHLIFKYRASKTQKIFFRAAYKFLNFCRALLTVNISEMADKEKRMKTIEETFKAEKEILEDFFKNRISFKCVEEKEYFENSHRVEYSSIHSGITDVKICFKKFESLIRIKSNQETEEELVDNIIPFMEYLKSFIKIENNPNYTNSSRYDIDYFIDGEPRNRHIAFFHNKLNESFYEEYPGCQCDSYDISGFIPKEEYFRIILTVKHYYYCFITLRELDHSPIKLIYSRWEFYTNTYVDGYNTIKIKLNGKTNICDILSKFESFITNIKSDHNTNNKKEGYKYIKSRFCTVVITDTVEYQTDFYNFLREENFIVEDEYVVIIIEGYHEYDREKEKLSINYFKTFKLEQCVICLEEEPKVLFCNCGHICICEKCASHRYDNCPVCKKENTILRIIE